MCYWFDQSHNTTAYLRHFRKIPTILNRSKSYAFYTHFVGEQLPEMNFSKSLKVEQPGARLLLTVKCALVRFDILCELIIFWRGDTMNAWKAWQLIGGLALFAVTAVYADPAPNPQHLIQGAIDHWRGDTSYGEVEMTVHRPDWERSMSMLSWTRGREDSLIRFTAPTKDAGNATLKLGQGMWIFTPKLNQIIKLPASMMAQSWMGSDFSYDDLAKTDKIIHEYTHTLIDTQQENKHTVYTIESFPKTGAPVVWGKERLRIRDDFVLLEETFFDQDLQPAKRMETLKIGPIGGRDYPVVMRMTTLDKPDHWTEIKTRHAIFDLALPNYLFTLSNLRNPRPWSAP
jgi:hypothetical protein